MAKYSGEHFDVSYLKKPHPLDERQNNKSVWIRVGRAFAVDDGTISLRLDALPMSGCWDGTLKLYPKTTSQEE